MQEYQDSNVQMGMTGREDTVRTKRRMVEGGWLQIKIQAPGSEAWYRAHRCFYGDGELRLMGTGGGVLDPCVEGRTLFTLIH